MVELFANSEDPDQTPRSAASDQGLLYLPITRFGSVDYNGLSINLQDINALLLHVPCHVSCMFPAYAVTLDLTWGTYLSFTVAALFRKRGQPGLIELPPLKLHPFPLTYWVTVQLLTARGIAPVS